MEREVRQTGKTKDGDITRLCNPGQSWSPRSKQHAIDDIESGRHRYYVNWNGKKVYVKVVSGWSGAKYLRTEGDETERNNLEELPDC